MKIWPETTPRRLALSAIGLLILTYLGVGALHFANPDNDGGTICAPWGTPFSVVRPGLSPEDRHLTKVHEAQHVSDLPWPCWPEFARGSRSIAEARAYCVQAREALRMGAVDAAGARETVIGGALSKLPWQGEVEYDRAVELARRVCSDVFADIEQ